MSRFAPVVPLGIANRLKDWGVLGAYHLLLAHDVTPATEDEYKAIYVDYVRTLADPLVIMDNSVVELGTALTLERVLYAANVVRADYMVAPDLFLETDITIERSKAFYYEAISLAGRGVKMPKLLGVVQGKTFYDCMRCAEFYASYPMFEAISVPRCLTAVLGTRMNLLMELYKKWHWRFKHWHLLGFSDDIFDDLSSARLPFVHGIDSAVPIRAAMQELSITLPHTPVGPRGDFWNYTAEMADDHRTRIINNLQFIRRLI